MDTNGINYLIYRYLVESGMQAIPFNTSSGFSHSSFAFQTESAVRKIDLKGSSVQPGALISLLQKGLQYREVETHLNNVFPVK
jgi:transducin (beta)-like 1